MADWLLSFITSKTVIMNHIIPQSNRNLSSKSHRLQEGLSETSVQQEDRKKREEMEASYPDYPQYPPSEDIYSIYTKEPEIDPEQPSRLKEPLTLGELINQLDFNKEFSGQDLDVPGTELDDEQERIGSEDEENNYYSLGEDNHVNLDVADGEDI